MFMKNQFIHTISRLVLISHPSGNLSNFLMPLNKLLTLSTKRSGFIVSLPLEKFETREQKEQRHLPSESRKKFHSEFYR